MQDGNDEILVSARKAIRHIAEQGLTDEAQELMKLLNYTSMLNKNQIRLIKALIKKERANGWLWKLNTRMYIMMNQGHRNMVDVWMKENVL